MAVFGSLPKYDATAFLGLAIAIASAGAVALASSEAAYLSDGVEIISVVLVTVLYTVASGLFVQADGMRRSVYQDHAEEITRAWRMLHPSKTLRYHRYS